MSGTQIGAQLSSAQCVAQLSGAQFGAQKAWCPNGMAPSCPAPNRRRWNGPPPCRRHRAMSSVCLCSIKTLQSMALGAVGVRGVSGTLRAATLPGPEVGAVTVLCPDMEGSRVKATTTRMKTVGSIHVQVSRTANITFYQILMTSRGDKCYHMIQGVHQ